MRRWPTLLALLSLSSLPWPARPQPELRVVLRNLCGGPVALYWLDRSAGGARRALVADGLANSSSVPLGAYAGHEFVVVRAADGAEARLGPLADRADVADECGAWAFHLAQVRAQGVARCCKR